jgi:hypothetical protein
MGRRVWLIGLWLYALVASVDFAYHLAYPPGGDRPISYSEIPVAFSAALFWPVDIVAIALLAGQ